MQYGRIQVDTSIRLTCGSGWEEVVKSANRRKFTTEYKVRAAYRVIDSGRVIAEVAERGSLPVVLFTAGGIATPADAAMMMELGADGVFVGSGIFKSGEPKARAEAIVQATRYYDDPEIVAKVSRGLGEALVGINDGDLSVHHRLEDRGW